MAGRGDEMARVQYENSCVKKDMGTSNMYDLRYKCAYVMSNNSDVACIEETSVDDLALSIYEGLKERYQQRMNIYKGNDSWPSSYAFYCAEEPIPHQSAHFQVSTKFKRTSIPDFEIGSELLWLKLDQVGQDKLYFLLGTGVAISKRISWDNEKDWLKRFDHSDSPQDETHWTLKNYYGSLPKSVYSVMEYLCRGRTQAEMQRVVHDIVEKGFMHHRIDTAWSSALVGGMTNDLGRIAVSKLLEAILTLIPKLQIWEDVPDVAVFNVSSSESRDAFCISSSTLSSSGRTCCTPDAKRRKIDELETPKKEREGEDGRKKHYGSSNSGSDAHHHFVDLYVITRDNVSGVSKYLFLVEIHSAGKTFLEANQTFVQELIYVLQAQSQVFGLFISETDIVLYSASKDKYGIISVSKTEYNMLAVAPGKCDTDSFFVPLYQKMIMDIFTCMVHAIKNVDA